MKLFTIGFTQKSARQFFELLKQNQIKTLVDIRLNNVSQLAGFTKGNDLKYFLQEICKADYLHLLELAPSKEILDGYKGSTLSWDEYEKQYMSLLGKRNIKEVLDDKFKSGLDGICLLCSEPTPEKCHRRLAAEFIRDIYEAQCIEVIHL